MILLDDLILTPTAEQLAERHAFDDSVRTAAMQMLRENPSEFWTNLTDQALHFGLKVLAALAIYVVGAWLINRLKKLLVKVFAKRQTEETLASFLISFVSIILTVLLIIVTVSTLGVDTTSLAALLAAGGMAIGMALSGTVQNFAGGIMLLAFKPFKAGDFIETQGIKGIVKEVTIVSTKILTPDNRVVIIPNGSLSSETIDNYSAQPLRRVDWEVSVAYGTDADECVKALLELVLLDMRVLTSKDERPKAVSSSAVDMKQEPIPDPYVGLKSLNSNDISFVVRAWVRSDDYWDVFFDGQKRFYTELQKRGFQFAYPHCDVTILNK